MAELTLGGKPITRVTEAAKLSRLSMLLWGSAGTGKTTLACTAPGRKLLINFDPDGYQSVRDDENVSVVDLSDARASVTEQFKIESDPFGLSKIIDNFDTIIVDSLTNVAHKTTMQGIAVTKGATIERPSPGAYGVRNALVTQLVKNMLALTNRHKKHIIFIAHEDAPVTNEDGVVMHITLSLGGKLPEQAALDFSEVWCVQDMGAGRDRRIMVRPCRNRKPMKTRMFETSGEPEFSWKYNPDKHEGMTIASWYEKWLETGTKLPIPTGK